MKVCWLMVALLVSLGMGSVEAREQMNLDPVTLQADSWLTAADSAKPSRWDAVGCKRPAGKSFALPEGGLVACRDELNHRVAITLTLIPKGADNEFQMI